MNEQDSLRIPRIRLNVSQSTKGIHSFDATIEVSKEKWDVSDPTDVSVTEEITIGQRLLDIIKDAEDKFRKDGRKLAGDKE